MSNQVYGNDTLPTPNVYVSQLVTAVAGGGTSVRSLTIADTPTTNNTNFPFLVRNPVTHAVEQRDSDTVPHSGLMSRIKAVDQGVNSGAEVAVLFPITIRTDPALSYTSVAGRFTVNSGYEGVFTVAWTVTWSPNAVGTRWTWVNVNGQPARYGSINSPAVSGFDMSLSGSVDLVLGAGESFIIAAYQNSGSNLSLLGFDTNGVDFTSVHASRTSIAGTQ